MSRKNHVRKLITVLNYMSIKYAFTGAFALSYYGYPRTSSDIDIIIERNKVKLEKLVKVLQENAYDISENDVLDAIDRCGHFAVFFKEKMFPYFDFKVACERDEINTISNHRVVKFHGIKCRIVSVEDLMVEKIEWGDLKDVKTILIRYKDKINMKKLFKLVKAKHLHAELEKLLKESGSYSGE